LKAPETFPILGGRLLKYKEVVEIFSKPIVSNPWREAIEERGVRKIRLLGNVSNPWREAIEDAFSLQMVACPASFQSLEGGY